MEENLKILEEKLIKFKEKYGEDEVLKNFESEVIEANNYALSYFFAKEFYDSNKIKHQEIVIKSNNLEYNYLFAKNVSNIDPSKNGQVIIDSNNTKYSYLFARDININDKTMYAKIVLDSGNIDYIYLFALSVDGISKIPFVAYLYKEKRYDLINNLLRYCNEDESEIFRKYISKLNLDDKLIELKKDEEHFLSDISDILVKIKELKTK
ncbi:MAG: hypothetical protein PUC23_02365 [bacterium]|nr:hypothetical protein [bacterium]